MLLTLIIPIFIVILVSFSTHGAYGGFEFDFTTKHYYQLLFNEGWSGASEFNPQYLGVEFCSEDLTEMKKVCDLLLAQKESPATYSSDSINFTSTPENATIQYNYYAHASPVELDLERATYKPENASELFPDVPVKFAQACSPAAQELVNKVWTQLLQQTSLIDFTFSENPAMTRDPRYDILFEPVRIGPVTAKNRFYQVPHCNGGGYRDPSAAAEMRSVKAEGGWGVIFTEQSEMHHTSEITPFIELRLWEDKAIPNALKRSRTAGFDLVCLYGAHGFGIFQHLLSRATNHRTDEYGGSLENRARFIREMVVDAHNTIGDTMGNTLRLSLDELIGDLGFANSEVRYFNIPTGEVILFDDDHYYMGGVLAELLAQKGANVTLITPSAFVSDWTRNTLEQAAIHRRLIEVGVNIVLNRGVIAVAADHVESNCVYTDQRCDFPADAVVIVTSRQMNDEVWLALQSREPEWQDAGIRSVNVIGDAQAPGPIAWATYAGHRFARELDMPDLGDQLPFRREITQLHLETS